MTLSQASLRTHTTASCSAHYPAHQGDSLLLNGSAEPIQNSPRTQACLSHLRSLRATLEASDPSLPKLSVLPLHIVSSNNFPTAAGLASSAAGFAALVRSIADLYALPHSATELSRIARQGSGSACRSLMGGYVAWRAGSKDDGSDSLADEVAPAAHWPQMRALVLVVSAAKKHLPSTAGMQVTVKTSSLFHTRAQVVVPARMQQMERAIRERDFDAFARLTMQDSNGFHAVCLDSWPPIAYLNDVSRAAVRIVEAINQPSTEAGAGLLAAYTFDAGPNAVVYYLDRDTERVAGVFRALLGDRIDGWEGSYGQVIKKSADTELATLDEKAVDTLRAGVSRVICTGVGGGPEKVDRHLVDERGEPVRE